ncbi:MAG TPA: class I SAM-dependent methyltransferase, partial [Epsilonproteobacteria bacterium]|nr:class I SAM-dependent methyltransferase [Campylobacterota bacterium]
MKHDDTTIKEGIRNTFNQSAPHYDENLQFVLSAQKMASLAGCKCEDEAEVLDLSTGTGHIAIEIAGQFPKVMIDAVDLSEEMLAAAKSKSEEAGIDTITYHCQDVENLQLGDKRYDLITCGYGIFFYPNMDATFQKIFNRLSEGGQFIFSTFTEEAFEPYSKLLLEMLKEGYDLEFPK